MNWSYTSLIHGLFLSFILCYFIYFTICGEPMYIYILSESRTKCPENRISHSVTFSVFTIPLCFLSSFGLCPAEPPKLIIHQLPNATLQQIRVFRYNAAKALYVWMHRSDNLISGERYHTSFAACLKRWAATKLKRVWPTEHVTDHAWRAGQRQELYKGNKCITAQTRQPKAKCCSLLSSSWKKIQVVMSALQPLNSLDKVPTPHTDMYTLTSRRRRQEQSILSIVPTANLMDFAGKSVLEYSIHAVPQACSLWFQEP